MPEVTERLLLTVVGAPSVADMPALMVRLEYVVPFTVCVDPLYTTVLPPAVAVNVVIGTEEALMFSVDDALFVKAVIVPELARFTMPAALFVMPVIAPDPLRFIVPQLEKLAIAVVVVPAPVRFIIPLLSSEVIAQEPAPAPLKLSVPLLISVPVPESEVVSVKVPLLIYEPPVIVAFTNEVIVGPLKAIPAPVNVLVVLVEVNEFAKFVKLPVKVGVLRRSLYDDPELSVKSPLNIFALPPDKFIAPDMFVAPFTVSTRELVSVPPVFIVSEPIIFALVPELESVPPLLIVTEPV